MESGSLSRISRVWALQVLAYAVVAHDLISPSKFLEQEYFDYFCLLLFDFCLLLFVMWEALKEPLGRTGGREKGG